MSLFLSELSTTSTYVTSKPKLFWAAGHVAYEEFNTVRGVYASSYSNQQKVSFELSICVDALNGAKLEPLIKTVFPPVSGPKLGCNSPTIA